MLRKWFIELIDFLRWMSEHPPGGVGMICERCLEEKRNAS